MELPEGWVSIRLEEHVYIAGRIGWRGLKAEEYTAAGPILLSVPNLNYGDTVDFREVNHISGDRYEESPEMPLKLDWPSCQLSSGTFGKLCLRRRVRGS